MAEVRRRRSEYWAGLGAVAAIAVVAMLKLWPVPHTASGRSVTQLLLGDRILVGVLRLGILVSALYGIASVPAQIVGGRWVKGLGTTGIVVDDARVEANLTVERSRRELEALRARDARLTAQLEELQRVLATRPDEE